MPVKRPRLASPKLAPAIARRRQLERDVEHITQEMYRRNRELAETNQTLSLLQTIDGLALDSAESLSTVCDKIASAIADAAGFPLVGILTTATGSMSDLELHGLNLKDNKLWYKLLGHRRVLDVEIEPAWWPKDTQTKLISLADLDAEQTAQLLGCHAETVRRLHKQLGIQSLYVVQLTARARLAGFMLAGFYGFPDQVPQQDITLLDRLSEPVGVALDNRLLFEENRRVLAQLRRSNAKLQALDETKDEFITMASHQLRTPLTAIKGYISMVLEGDAGALNPSQQKLLEQSFVSSQRMVFLISDLLNLSRLNTGKFVIEPTPVQLADVVTAEVEQLKETARSRDVKLLYDKPAGLPKLMLDETKIHQVVMNFMDNAIYYTPAGGRIVISLTETPTAVEYRVQDNGIGVPKHEQHKLFSKFYRAGNARRARPDGTGLGLFMAKKVIAAQGGAIIFDSQEGKGSTFGFRFSKAGHAVPAGQPATPAEPLA
ncbi:MAG: HAMP domain-containing sensor histidine kinase [Candidatus Saccharibacteria bacterium]